MERFKIINKSKDGITIRLNSQNLKMTWEEFESNFTQVGHQMAEMKPEYKAQLDRIDDKLTWLTVHVRRNQVIELHKSKGVATEKEIKEQLSLLYSIGSLLDELSESMGCMAVQVMELVNQRLNTLLSHSTPEFRERYDKNHKKTPEPQAVPSAKMTLGDHPEFSKLKDLFKDADEAD